MASAPQKVRRSTGKAPRLSLPSISGAPKSRTEGHINPDAETWPSSTGIARALPTAPEWERLQAWASNLEPAPLLLSGSNETSLGDSAHELAQAMLCEKNKQAVVFAAACGKCRACHLLASGNHPDLLRLHTDEATWTIKDMRQLFTAVTYTPSGHRRVVIIEAIEKVSLPAANALLKSLEEPRSSTSFIVTTHRPSSLLPTIRSRCAHIRLSPVIATTATAPLNIEALTTLDLTPETLEILATRLHESLGRQGATPALRRAYARLRDYHFIASRHGNSKLAGEVLLLSLPVGNGMS